MPRTPKTVGPRKLPHRYPNEALWGVAGHDGQTNFVTGIIVSNGKVVSVPNILAWMDKRDWLECVELCLEKGYRVWQSDPEQVTRQYARNERGVVQTALPLDPVEEGDPTLQNTSSPSSVALLNDCARAWEGRYRHGREGPRTPPLLLGSAVDQTVEAFLRRRWRKEWPTVEWAALRFHEAWEADWAGPRWWTGATATPAPSCRTGSTS